MNQLELNKILDDHELWLEDNKKGERANLTDLDLHGLDFSGRKLNHIILRGADCTGANFYKTFLGFADCTSIIFYKTILIKADCTGANFTGTTLTKALLAGAILTDTKLSAPIIQIGGIGSRKDFTVYHVADNIVQCGYWNKYLGGSLEEFIDLINEEYPEASTEPDELKDRSEYLAAIEFFKANRDIYLQSIEGE